MDNTVDNAVVEPTPPHKALLYFLLFMALISVIYFVDQLVLGARYWNKTFRKSNCEYKLDPHYKVVYSKSKKTYAIRCFGYYGSYIINGSYGLREDDPYDLHPISEFIDSCNAKGALEQLLEGSKPTPTDFK